MRRKYWAFSAWVWTAHPAMKFTEYEPWKWQRTYSRIDSFKLHHAVSGLQVELFGGGKGINCTYAETMTELIEITFSPANRVLSAWQSMSPLSLQTIILWSSIDTSVPRTCWTDKPLWAWTYIYTKNISDSAILVQKTIAYLMLFSLNVYCDEWRSNRGNMEPHISVLIDHQPRFFDIWLLKCKSDRLLYRHPSTMEKWHTVCVESLSILTLPSHCTWLYMRKAMCHRAQVSAHPPIFDKPTHPSL